MSPTSPSSRAAPANLMSVTPKASWPWVKTLLHSVYDQPDAASVADHLDTARADVLAFSAFPKELWRQTQLSDPAGRCGPGRTTRRMDRWTPLPRPGRAGPLPPYRQQQRPPGSAARRTGGHQCLSARSVTAPSRLPATEPAPSAPHRCPAAPTNASAAPRADNRPTAGASPRRSPHHRRCQRAVPDVSSTASTNATTAANASPASNGARTANDPATASTTADPAPAAARQSPSPTCSRRLCPNLTTPDHVVTASHTTSEDSTRSYVVLYPRCYQGRLRSPGKKRDEVP